MLFGLFNIEWNLILFASEKSQCLKTAFGEGDEKFPLSSKLKYILQLVLFIRKFKKLNC